MSLYSRRHMVGFGALGLAVLAWWFWPGPLPGEPARVADLPSRVATVPLELTAPPQPMEGAAPEEAPVLPGGFANAHATIAEELGLLAIRCYVGPEMDAPGYVGSAYVRVVRDGWFSDVVTTLEGVAAVERAFRDPNAPPDADDRWATDFETRFFVSWKAERFGGSVPCKVHWPAYGDVAVEVIDEDGAPVAGVQVSASGVQDTTDAHGTVELTGVLAGIPLQVHVSCGDVGLCKVLDPVLPPLREHESRSATVTVSLLVREESSAEEVAEWLLANPIEGMEYGEETFEEHDARQRLELSKLRAMLARDGLEEKTRRLVEEIVGRREAANAYMENLRAESEERMMELGITDEE